MIIKEAFVRPDGSHELLLVAVAPLLVAPFLTAFRSSAIPICALLLSALLTIAAFEAVPHSATYERPDQAVHNLFNEAADLVSGSKRDELVAAAKETMNKEYSLPSRIISGIRGHSVDVDPTEQNVTWSVPNVEMQTLQVVQDYAAYTASLDNLDAKALSGGTAPQEILRQAGTFDNVPAAWDPPQTQLTMECRYRQMAASTSWQLTVHSANRCGRPKFLDTTRTTQGQLVKVPDPSPGTAVLATFSVAVPLSSQVENIALQPPLLCVRAVLGNGSRNWYRFVAGTEGDLHVLRPASTLGYSPMFTPDVIKEITVTPCSTIGAGFFVAFHPSSAELKVSFFEMAIRPH